MTLTPTQALARQAQIRPADTALQFNGETWTYQKLADEAERVARGLAANGVKAGDRVVLHMTTRPEMLVALYACFRLGAIAAPLGTRFAPIELAAMLKRLEPALYIGESASYPNVGTVDQTLLAKRNRILVEGAERLGARPWEALRQADPSADLAMPPVNEPIALLVTSGTTGQPKFVAHTLQTLGAATGLIASHLALSADDRVISQLSLAHASGFFLLMGCVASGTPLFMLEGFDPHAMLDNIERHRGTLLFGFPYHYANLIAAQQAKPRDTSSLRLCLTGGDVCPIDLQRQATAGLGATLYNVWGATEVLGALTYAPKHGAVVRMAKESQFRLLDANGNDVHDGNPGELLIRGPSVFVGYWNDPDATARALDGGWYRTGDVMRRGEGDELWFVSRVKDVIIRGGTNISPVEVEDALVACHPAVREAAVVGKPDPVLGHRVYGFVQLAPGADELRVVAEILSNLTWRLAAYKVPEDLQVLDALPRNALSKVDRRALERLLTEVQPSRQYPVPMQKERPAHFHL